MASIRQAPFFGALQAVAQSVVHDAIITTMPTPTPEMAAVRVPTLVLRGGRTWTRLATACERLADMLPQATLQLLPEASDHGLMPVATAAAILDSARTASEA